MFLLFTELCVKLELLFLDCLVELGKSFGSGIFFIGRFFKLLIQFL